MATGMTLRNHRKDWTTEQEEFLLDSYGETGMQFLMDRLGKTEEAIRLKHEQLVGFTDFHKATGTLSPKQVADVLGVAHKTIIDWIHRFGFPATRKYKLRNDTKRRKYFIEQNKVWKWVEKNKERVNFTSIQRGVIIPEPAWLEDEIKRSFADKIKRGVIWTIEEEEAAWFWYKGGMKYREIANRLNRTEKAARNRIPIISKRKQQEALLKH